MSDSFRCSAAALARGDELAGTASTVRSFLLVEHAGSWGIDAFRDSRLPHGLGPAIRRAALAAGVRPLLIRRPGGRPHAGPVRIFAAHTTPAGGRVETATIDHLDDVLDLDLHVLAGGGPLGLTEHRDPLYLVCTHGRHDACCAELGRPLAAALAGLRPGQVWECSHLGGDRFAGNLLLLPDGLYHGRIAPGSAADLVAATDAGRLDLTTLRGRCALPMPVQAAEIALRRRLDLSLATAVRYRSHHSSGPTTTARFDADGAAYDVVVSTEPADERALLTCRASLANPVPVHRILDLARPDDR